MRKMRATFERITEDYFGVKLIELRMPSGAVMTMECTDPDDSHLVDSIRARMEHYLKSQLSKNVQSSVLSAGTEVEVEVDDAGYEDLRGVGEHVEDGER